MSEEKDYTRKGFTLTLTVIVMLVGVLFIPPFTIGGVTIKRANILSDLIDFGDTPVASEITSKSLLDTSFLAIYNAADAAEFAEGFEGLDFAELTAPPDGEISVQQPSKPRLSAAVKPVVTDSMIVGIEDFSPGETMMSRFYNALAHQTSVRPVRIAVLGDSFIEADIITADLREQLQTRYGGRGVGFVPFSTPLSKFRGSIKHTHDGWDYHNIIKLKNVPEEYRSWFFVSGIISVSGDKAKSEYAGTSFRDRVESAGSASLIFTNRGDAQLDVVVNGSQQHSYTPSRSENVDIITIRKPDISQLSVTVTNAKGFIGYGVVLEDTVGVSVHNFSVRSNSGMALLATDYKINSEINAIMPYDLIILQYGLNAMAAEVTDYRYYADQLRRIINYMRKCFPESAILVMSVGDRSSLKGGTATTMPAVEAMISAQRSAAQASGVGFWNTFKAMGGQNSMPVFVERKWASKDHTHIGYSGGKYIAGQLAAYLNAAVESVRSQSGPLLRILEDGLGVTYKTGAGNTTSTGMSNVPSRDNIRLQTQSFYEIRNQLSGVSDGANLPVAETDGAADAETGADDSYSETTPEEDGDADARQRNDRIVLTGATGARAD